MPGVRSDRQRVMDKLGDLLRKYPDLRVCQLIGNAYPEKQRKRRGDDMYYVTDKDLYEWLDAYDKKITQMAMEAASERPSGRRR